MSNETVRIIPNVVSIENINLPTWDDFSLKNIVLPLLFLIFCSVAVFPLQLLVAKLHRAESFLRVFQAWKLHQNLYHPIVGQTFNAIDFGLSLLQVGIWIRRSYVLHVETTDLVIELLINIFFACRWIAYVFRVKFSVWRLWGYSSLLHVFVFFPVFVPCSLPSRGAEEVFFSWMWRWNDFTCSSNPDDQPLFSLSYIRALSLLILWSKLSAQHDLSQSSRFGRDMVMLGIRAVGLLVFFSCSVYILEILGEHPGVHENFVSAEMGHISFFQMMYFIMCTISTVGYGDFSPKTTLSRCIVMLFIVMGIIYFSNEVAAIIDVRAMRRNGFGWYHGKGHVIICGSALNQSSVMLETFLEQILHTSNGWNLPDVVLLTEGPIETMERMRAFVQLASQIQSDKVSFLRGSVFNETDLLRVNMGHSASCFVVGDTTSSNYSQQDAENLYRVMSIRSFCRQAGLRARIRIMLLKPESKVRALNVGIPNSRCFSAMVLKGTMIGLSARIKGAIPFFCSLIINPPTSRKNAKDFFGINTLYHESLENKLHACVLKSHYVGMAWPQFCLACYKHGVTPIAIQKEGALFLCPFEHVIGENEVLFAIATEENMKPLINSLIDWQTTHLQDEELPPCAKNEFHRHALAIGDVGERATFAGRLGSALQNMRLEYALQDEIADDTSTTQHVSRCPSGAEFEGTCISIIVFGTPSWPQIATLLRTLHSEHLPASMYIPNIIVLTEVAPPSKVVDIFEPYGVTFVVGSPGKTENLTLAGVRVASVVLSLMGPLSEGVSHTSSDHKVVIGSVILQRYLLSHNCNPDVVVHEFVDGAKASLLLADSYYARFEDSTSDVVDAVKRASTRVPDASVAWTGLKTLVSKVQAVLEGAQSSKYWHQRKRLLHYEPKFAAGQLFSTEVFGYTLAFSFYMPGWFEVVSAFCVPCGLETSFLWQILVPPPFVGQTFGNFFRSVTQKGKLACVPVAIYRKNVTDCGDIREYSVTNPDPATVLSDADLITVIGGQVFAQTMLEEGLMAQANSSASTDSRTEEADVKRIINQFKVSIFSKNCVASRKAIEAVERVAGENNPHVKIISLDKGALPRISVNSYYGVFKKMTNSPTIPKIFVNGEHTDITNVPEYRLRQMLIRGGVIDPNADEEMTSAKRSDWTAPTEDRSIAVRPSNVPQVDSAPSDERTVNETVITL